MNTMSNDYAPYRSLPWTSTPAFLREDWGRVRGRGEVAASSGRARSLTVAKVKTYREPRVLLLQPQ